MSLSNPERAITEQDLHDFYTSLLPYLNNARLPADYADLVDKPQINGNTLNGNKTSAQLGLQNTLTAGQGITIQNDTISATSSSVSYSTTEHVVGQWVDGSTLYEITINNTIGGTGNDREIHVFNNTDHVVIRSFEGTVGGADGKQNMIGSWYDDNNYVIPYMASDGFRLCIKFSDENHRRRYNLTVRYTKGT